LVGAAQNPRLTIPIFTKASFFEIHLQPARQLTCPENDFSSLRIAMMASCKPFLHRLEDGLNWIDTKYPVFVDAGIRREFRYVTALDSDVRFIMIYSMFDHERKRFGMDRPEQYRISKTFTL
jgi:hypothetical protein